MCLAWEYHPRWPSCSDLFLGLSSCPPGSTFHRDDYAAEQGRKEHGRSIWRRVKREYYIFYTIRSVPYFVLQVLGFGIECLKAGRMGWQGLGLFEFSRLFHSR